MVTTTVRFPESLYQQVADYAKENDFSKNQVIKMAVREFLRGQNFGGGVGSNQIAGNLTKK